MDDNRTVNIDPISLSKWLQCHDEEIDQIGHRTLFDESYGFTTRVQIYGGDFKHCIRSDKKDDRFEIFLWQMVTNHLLKTFSCFNLILFSLSSNDNDNNNDIR